MKTRLEERQEQMRLEQEQARKSGTTAERRLCALGCGRVARKGKEFCSRCTVKGLVEQERSVLPGVQNEANTPKSKIDPVHRHQLKYEPGDLTVTGIASQMHGEPVAGPIFDPKTQQFYPPDSYDITTETFTKPPLTISQVNATEATFTRKQVCQQLGIGQTTLQRWEKKGYTPQPQRIVHSGACVYTQEMFEKIKQFKEQTYTPPTPVAAPGEPDKPGVFRPRGQKFGKEKKLERTVAAKLNFGRNTLIH